MNKLLLTTTLIAGLAVSALVGCSKSEDGTVRIDTAKVESAFSTAAAVDKAAAEKAINYVKAGDYNNALTSLKEAVANVKLTPEQKQALTDLIAEVQAKITAAAKDAVNAASKAGQDAVKAGQDAAKTTGEAAQKTAEDLKKSLGK